MMWCSQFNSLMIVYIVTNSMISCILSDDVV